MIKMSSLEKAANRAWLERGAMKLLGAGGDKARRATDIYSGVLAHDPTGMTSSKGVSRAMNWLRAPDLMSGLKTRERLLSRTAKNKGLHQMGRGIGANLGTATNVAGRTENLAMNAKGTVEQYGRFAQDLPGIIGYAGKQVQEHGIKGLFNPLTRNAAGRAFGLKRLTSDSVREVGNLWNTGKNTVMGQGNNPGLFNQLRNAGAAVMHGAPGGSPKGGFANAMRDKGGKW